MPRIIFILLISFFSVNAFAELKLPSILADNMILQQNKQNPIWGWATPGQAVKIKFREKEYRTNAGANGEWKIMLNAAKGGEKGTMVISAGNEIIVLRDILFGEVWLCSGQSNMEYTMGGFRDFYRSEIAHADDKELRFVVLKNSFSNKENSNAELKSSWSAINERSIENCSAVAYFFAKKLRKKLNMPVGLVISSWGGTPAQSWVDTTTLKGFTNYWQLYDNSIKPLDFSQLDAIREKNDKLYKQKLIGISASFNKMTDINFDDTGWEKCHLPGEWESQGHPNLDGIAAYRTSFTVPPGDENKDAVLHLPAIDDVDSTYINGVFIGSQRVWNELRVYKVPSKILHAGKNVLTIWVEDGGGGGGLNEDPDNYYLELQGKKIWLKGDATFKVLAPLENIAPGVNYASLQNEPAVLFNAMVAPLLTYNFAGVIWYQGESNADNFVEYRKLFPSLINCWRTRFNQKDLPFLFVQLSSYNPQITEPAESNWAGLREAQTGALQLSNTGMAVTIDVGDQKDIHPKRKQEVGDRLAANAFNIVYGYKKEVPAGPLYRSFTVSGNTIKISFTNIGKGLVVNGDKIIGFTIAGADKKFVAAEAVIAGDEIIVSAPGLSSPMYVRYAWANAPITANLYNKEGFPAAPFRTDKQDNND